MRNASVSLLDLGSSDMTRDRTAAALVSSSSGTQKGFEAGPRWFSSWRIRGVLLLVGTCSLHEGPVQPEGHQRFLQSSQEILQKSTDHVDVLDLTEQQRRLPLKDTVSKILHRTLPSRDPVQTSLQTDR